MFQTPTNSVWLNPGDTTPETYNLYPASLCKASEALSIRESFVKFKSLHGVAAHLHHIKSAKFDPATFLWVIHLGALDDDGMCRKVDAPRQRRRRHQHLNVSVSKQVLHQRPVNPAYNDITHTSHIQPPARLFYVHVMMMTIFTVICYHVVNIIKRGLA